MDVERLTAKRRRFSVYEYEYDYDYDYDNDNDEENGKDCMRCSTCF